MKTDKHKHPSGSIFMYICGHHSGIKIKNDRRLAPYPMLEVGLLGGLHTFLDYLIEPFKKIELDTDSA